MMKRTAALILLAALWSQAALAAFEPFTVEDIRIDGLTRIAPGTVFANLPVERGDRVDRERASQAIRALFKTGFFNDVELDREGNILVVRVVERPAISKITITGNKDLKEEDLMKGLKEIGLSEGETYDRLALDRVTQELTRQYNNRGKYNVTIKPKVTELDRNRVEIAIEVAEGKAAHIKHLNIVGNTKFSDKEIREDFDSNTSNWLSWYSSDDQYSREKVSGDIEKITSFYQDRGYVDFSVESTQVSISPDKKDIYITMGVREGEIYTLSDVKLTGDLILDEQKLLPLIRAHPGEIYSRKKLEQSAEAISVTLSNIGFAFADVSPVPAIDKEERKVAVTLLVNPGKRVYVRRINFSGNVGTQDEVLRREMRQVEGAWYSQAAIDRSKIRLQRLGFFKRVEIDTPKVPGTEDQVDVNVKVEEQSAGAFQFGFGYSALEGLLTSVSVTERNFLGTGNSISATVQNNSVYKRFDFNYFNPYLTDDGISAGYNFYYRELDQGQANVANYTTDSVGGSFSTAIPLTETTTLSSTLGIDKTKITTFPGITPASIIDFINEAGHETFHSWRFSAGWASDTRNKYFAPTRGSYLRAATEVVLPGQHRGVLQDLHAGPALLPVQRLPHLPGVGRHRLRRRLRRLEGAAVLRALLRRRRELRARLPRQHARTVRGGESAAVGLLRAARRRLPHRVHRRAHLPDSVRQARRRTPRSSPRSSTSANVFENFSSFDGGRAAGLGRSPRSSGRPGRPDQGQPRLSDQEEGRRPHRNPAVRVRQRILSAGARGIGRECRPPRRREAGARRSRLEDGCSALCWPARHAMPRARDRLCRHEAAADNAPQVLEARTRLAREFQERDQK
jgi:outer membrane protein insertion porin family